MKRLCCRCQHHVIINDADPLDQETIDDVAVLCSLVENDLLLPDSRIPSERSEYRAITVACKPDETHEAMPLEWCPIPEEEFYKVEIPKPKGRQRKTSTKVDEPVKPKRTRIKKDTTANIIIEDIKVGKVVG